MIDPGITALTLIAVGILIAINGLCVFNEFALVSIPRARAAALRDQGGLIGRLVHRSVEHLDDYIAADQLGITATSIAVGWIGQPAVSAVIAAPLDRLGLGSAVAVPVVAGVLAFTLITGTQMIFGELVPKSIALRHPERTARLIALPIEVMARALRPLTILLNGLGRLILRPFGIDARRASMHGSVDPADLVDAVMSSASAGLLGVRPGLVNNAVLFGELTAREVMRPRHEVVGLSMDLSLQQVLEQAGRAPHVRYPVYEGDDLDAITGYLSITDLADLVDRDSADSRAWRARVRPITGVFEGASVEVVMGELQSRGQIALVVDEYGGTEGIVTVADMVRALTTDHARGTADTSAFVVRGSELVRTLEFRLGVELTVDAPITTVNGLVVERLGRLPQPGDRVELGGHRLEVLQTSKRKAERVRVQRISDVQSAKEGNDRDP